MKNKTIIKNKIIIIAVLFFAVYAVFGLSVFTLDDKDSNISKSSASAQEPADINNDNVVDIFDLSTLLGNWNVTGANTSDLNNDNTVNIFDLSQLLSKWGVVAAAPGGTSMGAKLPINYDIATVTGAKIYVSPADSDLNGNGTVGAPYKTIRKAVVATTISPTTILVDGGTYDLKSEANTTTYSEWGKLGYAISIKAMPGKLPIFDGSKIAPTTTTPENGSGAGGANLKYFAYDTVAGGIGSGLALANLPAATFSGTTPTGIAAEYGYRCVGSTGYALPSQAVTAINPSGCAAGETARVITAYFADQAWYNGVRLKQVLDKNKVTPSTFYVDREFATDASSVPSKMYVDSSININNLRITSNKHDIRIVAPNTTIEGIKIVRNSPGTGTANYTSMYITNAADNSTIRDVVVEESSGVGLAISGSSTNALQNITLERFSGLNNGWQAAGAMYTDNLLVKDSEFSESNRDKEYAFAPASGAIKFSRTFNTKILNSRFNHNYSSGLWFDQSNYNAEVVGNQFTSNAASTFFYEISYGLLFAPGKIFY